MGKAERGRRSIRLESQVTFPAFVNLGTSAQWMGTTTDTFSFIAVDGRQNFKFRAIVKNGSGEATSAEVKLILVSKPTITGEPEDQTAQVGETVTFKVVATNADSYQWQIDRNDGKGFVNLGTSAQWRGTTTDTFSFVAVDGRQNFKFRAIVKNGSGEATSAEVKLILVSKPTIVIDDVTYERITSTTCAVVSYSGTASTLTIPETVEGMTVTEIGEEAFMGKTFLTSIDLPDTITIIRARAFKGCTSLSSMS